MAQNTAESFSSTQQPTPGGTTPNLAGIADLAKQITFTPVETWPKLKGRQESINDIYKNYLFYLAAIPPICALIGQTVFGISLPFVGTWRPPFFSALVASIVQYGVALGLIYVMAMIVEFLSPKFGGAATRQDGFKLVAYSMTPGYLAGFLGILPALSVIGGLLGLWGLFVYHKGIVPMAAATEDKRTTFFFVSLGCFILAMIVVALASMSVTPTPEIPADALKGFQEMMKGR